MSLAASPTFETLFNFRDLGGLAAGGATTASGRIFRADGVHRCNDADVAIIEQMGISRVIDLRTSYELDNDGSFEGRRPAIDYRHVAVLERVRGVAGAASEAETDARDTALIDTYRRILSTRGDQLIEVLDLIVSAPGPVVYHCTAGKDRTGLVSALVLSSVGVDDELIAADYGRSREAMTKLVEWYRTNRAADSTAVNLADGRSARLLGADPQWMLTVLAEIRAEYGSIEGYLVAMGAGRSLIDGLRARLLG